MDCTTIGMPGAYGHAADGGGHGGPARERWHAREYNAAPGPFLRPVQVSVRFVHAFPDLPRRAACRDHRRVGLRPRAPRHQRRAGSAARDVRRLDREPHRDPRAQDRRARGDHLDHGRGGGPATHGAARARAGRRRRADRRHRHARHGLPRNRLPHPGPGGAAEHLGLRPVGGLLGVPLRPHDRRPAGGIRVPPQGHRGRRGPHERHHRPPGPHHRRAVRRRRGRDPAGAGGGGFRAARLLSPRRWERPR